MLCVSARGRARVWREHVSRGLTLKPLPSQYAWLRTGKCVGEKTSGKVPVSAQKLPVHVRYSGGNSGEDERLACGCSVQHRAGGSRSQLYFCSLSLGLSIGGNVPEIGLRPSLCCTRFERLSISGGRVPEMKLPWIRMSSSASIEPSSGARVPPMHVYSIDQVTSFDSE